MNDTEKARQLRAVLFGNTEIASISFLHFDTILCDENWVLAEKLRHVIQAKSGSVRKVLRKLSPCRDV